MEKNELTQREKAIARSAIIMGMIAGAIIASRIRSMF